MGKKQQIGLVNKAKTNKTIIVEIQKKYQHDKYEKTLIKTKKYMTHDENNSCKFGDIVIIEDCRPISKKKRWILKEIIKTVKK